MQIFAHDYGIIPGASVSAQLTKLFSSLAEIKEAKELIIDSGTYFINAEDCETKTMFITNTVGDKEFSSGEKPHTVKVGVYLENISNLKIVADGAVFVLDGKMTNAALINCENVEIYGLEIRVANPDIHEFTVERVTPFSVNFRLDSKSCYEKKGGSFVFTGRDYKTDFFENRVTSWDWYPKVFADNKNHMRRAANPFRAALSIKEAAPKLFTCKYLNTRRFKEGERYCAFNTRRQFAGIFVDRSLNITLREVKQRFNYSLALVVQNTENLTVDRVDFSPEPESDRLFTSAADFIQVCMCKGDVRVTDSNFCGAGDDCLNVHGVHFSVVKADGKRLTVRFMHSQSHGYQPLHAGDKIEYVDVNTLLSHGEATILSAEMINEYDIELTVDSTDGLKSGDVIEDTTMCPNLYFARNKMTRIVTRGLLITTRGKVVVEDNDFDNTEMAAILFSDDAKNWYESGPCTDVTIRGNRFGDCGAYNIQILPENGKTGSTVHGDFLIENNSFESPENGGFDFNDAKSITLRGNKIKYPRDDFVKARNVKIVQ